MPQRKCAEIKQHVSDYPSFSHTYKFIHTHT